MLNLINAFLKGINDKLDEKERRLAKEKEDALEDEMDMYGLDEDEKEMVRNKEYDPCDFDTEGPFEDDDYYNDDYDYDDDDYDDDE